MSAAIAPGFLVLHGNRLEDLRRVVFDWAGQQPLAPLEEAIYLVQSNGIAEWLKAALAQDCGICAATRVELPARFLWRSYRQMLGRAAVPVTSMLDKAPLSWRLMRLLPGLLADPVYAPLQRFLADTHPLRLFQLAGRLADLFDQYQVYRADWLEDWAEGRDQLRRADGQLTVLGPDQRWQAALWRALLADLPEEERSNGRAGIHRRFVAALEAGVEPMQTLPRRVVLFGAATLPLQTLEALAALSRHCQVILAVPNPCRFHWADIIDGRELLRAAHRRHALRGGVDPACLPLEALHAHSNPLLASWGRLGRDFIRLLDEFDDAAAAQARFAIPRIDLFDDAPGETLLQQVQARIRELEPLDAENRPALPQNDRSIVFHIAHSALREVEILHDQLLSLLAEQSPKLTPRDIVVMVPEIETFAPAIRAVFGRYSASDSRFIPFTITDQKNRGTNPLLCALEWLLGLPEQRCTAGEIRDLLDVPALAGRFGLMPDDLPRLAQWIEGAGIRWGLSSAHRADLGLADCGEQNSWLFGLQRMLLGYASGSAGEFAGVEPYGEVGGLDAALAGSLAVLVARLQHWREVLQRPASPAAWGERLGQLLRELFSASDERDRLTLAALESALQGWLDTCATGGFAAAVPLAVVRESWLEAVDEPTLARRFLGAGVTFCTLMPMRAIPFEVVCLLGMNDGDYPRSTQRADFDLLAEPGQQRPGDRSRRDDDRYLMLEALLAARRQLYISWTGRSSNDNSPQPPSVLVSQLRDYLAAGWSGEVLAHRTTEHPLQPFSRQYFEGGELRTWSGEWRLAHQLPADTLAHDLPAFTPDPAFKLTLPLLADFLKSPVKHFFRYRLGVVFRDLAQVADNDEPFALNKLDEYQLVSRFLDQARQEIDGDIAQQIDQLAGRIARSGELPLAGLGTREQQQLVATITPVWQAWQTLAADWPDDGGKELLQFGHAGLMLEDWLDGLRSNAHGRAWLKLDPSVLCDKKSNPRPGKLIASWLRQLVASACGLPVTGIVVGRDAIVQLGALPQAEAQDALAALLENWRAGMDAPLPLASETALAFLAGGNARAAFEGGYNSRGDIGNDPALARSYPDFDALLADGRFAELATKLYGPLCEWLKTAVVTIHDSAASDAEAENDRAA